MAPPGTPHAVVERTRDDFPLDPGQCYYIPDLTTTQIRRERNRLLHNYDAEIAPFYGAHGKGDVFSFAKNVTCRLHGKLGVANGQKIDVVVKVGIRVRHPHRSWMLLLSSGGSDGWVPTMNLLTLTRYIWLQNLTGLTHGSVASVQVVVSRFLGANPVHFLQCRVRRFQFNLCHGGLLCLYFRLLICAWWRLAKKKWHQKLDPWGGPGKHWHHRHATGQEKRTDMEHTRVTARKIHPVLRQTGAYTASFLHQHHKAYTATLFRTSELESDRELHTEHR